MRRGGIDRWTELRSDEAMGCGSGWTLDGPPGPSSRCVVWWIRIASRRRRHADASLSAPFWTFVLWIAEWASPLVPK